MTRTGIGSQTRRKALIRRHRHLFWLSLFLVIFLVATKATYVMISAFWGGGPLSLFQWFAWTRSTSLLAWTAAISRSDLAFGIGVGLASQLVLLFVSRSARMSRILVFCFAVFGIICVAYGIIARQTFSYYNAHPSAQLIALSGEFARMTSSILLLFPTTVIIAAVGAPVLYALASWGTYRISRNWSPKRMRFVYLPAIAILGWWCWLGFQLSRTDKFFTMQDKYIHESAHWTILGSAFPQILGTNTSLSSVAVSDDDLEDFRTQGTLKGSIGRSDESLTGVGGRPFKNIILIVLESVGSRYLTVYDSASSLTPRLADEADHAVIFENYYSPVGWTAHDLTAILYGVYPEIRRSYSNNFSVKRFRFPVPSIGKTLRERGYKTVFLSSGDPDWGTEKVLDSTDFDLALSGSQLAPDDSHTSWGVRDAHVFDAVNHYLDEYDGNRFFLIAWTDQTHHPYTLANEEDNEHKSSFERYTTLIEEVDGQLGRLFDHIRDSGLDDDTIVVITGDHGEVFGSAHGAAGHGFSVYDDEVKVPLVLWSPRLKESVHRIATVGSHVDLAPTLFALLGEEVPSEWLGSSLLSPKSRSASYLFTAAWGEYLLGIRTDRWKYVHDARRGTNELYDMEMDPFEQSNVAEHHPESIARLRKRLATWLRFNDALYGSVE